MSAAAVAATARIPSPRPAEEALAGVGLAPAVLPVLFVPESGQWLSTTAGRVASDGYSWLQAVHWVAGSGLYEPRRHRSHGPRRFGPVTVWIAQICAEFSPCRPGVPYLVRRTGLSERSVEYHLQMLREAGLLAYITRGTRVRGERPQASEFALVVPPAFDAALGIRTAGQGPARRVTGIAERGRVLMAALGKKACRRARRPSAKAPRPSSRARAKKAPEVSETGVAGGAGEGPRCTPMEGGTAGSSTSGLTPLPPEGKLASGSSSTSTPNKLKAAASGKRALNAVGRRFQLARELTREVGWLRGCSVPRIAWVARHVADAGWTATEVQGWLHVRGQADRVRRGSGLLAVLLAGAETILDTPAKRADAVQQWRTAQEAARRHRIQQVRTRVERHDGGWQPPASRGLKRQVEQVFAQVAAAADGSRGQDHHDVADDQAAHLEPDEPELAALRLAAAKQLLRGDTELICTAVDSMGRAAAEHVYGEHLVHRALQLEAGSRSLLMTYGHR